MPKPYSVYARCAPVMTSMLIWQFHEQQEYKRNHAAHYANHDVPKVVSAALLSQPSRRGTLKIVKK